MMGKKCGVVIILLLFGFSTYSKGLPEKVDSSLKSHYPTLNHYKIAKYYDSDIDGGLLYEITFLNDRGLTMLLYFSLYGDFIFTEEEIVYDSLPEVIKNQVSKTKILYITRSRDFSDSTLVPEYYYVNGVDQIKNKQVIYHHYFSSDGKTIEKEIHQKGEYTTPIVILIMFILLKIAIMI